MSTSRPLFPSLATLLLFAAAIGCGGAEARKVVRVDGSSGADPTGGSGGASTGGSGGAGTGGAGGMSGSGGSGGVSGSGGAGGAGGSGGLGGSGTGGAGGGTGGSAGVGGSGGGGGAGGRDAGPSTGGTGGTRDASAAEGGGGSGPDGGSAVAICWPDPKVIMICHQLENACENCPPGGAPPKNKTAAACFDLVMRAYGGMATDADCAKFAVDNKCTVDNAGSTGNVCGSLNCYVPGCKDKARCLNRQQWGDSTMCTEFQATCGCK